MIPAEGCVQETLSGVVNLIEDALVVAQTQSG